MGMRLEIDMPEHHYNNIMAVDSVNLGRVPYKGIIMYAINAIKHGKVLDQKPTTMNDLGVDLVSRAEVLKLMQDNWHTHNGDWAMQESMDDIRALPPATPQEPKTGHCKDCKWWKDSDGKYRRGCGAESQCSINTHAVYCGEGYCYMFEPQESEET